MKRLITSLFFIICCNLLMAQQDTIYFIYDRFGYKNVAKRRFMELHAKEVDKKIPEFSTTMLTNKYKAENLDFISIPILGWNSQSYKCGDNLEPLIAFKQDSLFQKVLVITREKGLKVGAFEVFDSFNKKNRIKDSLDNVQFSLRGRPVMPDRNGVEKRIHKYCLENPNVLVFMIKNLDGYYAVTGGMFVKLVLRGGKIRGVPGSEFVCRHYGQEYINDVIADSFRIGYEYSGCADCKVNNSIKIHLVNR